MRFDAFAPGVWVAAITAFALLLRFHDLARESLWLDEIASIAFAKQPLHRLWSDWMVNETNPPLYYSLLKVWMAAFGDSDFAVRSLSAVIGACAVPLVYLLGRDLSSRRTGFMGALLTALWPFQIHYSQEARGYILGSVGALVAVLGLVRISDVVRGSPPTRDPVSPWLLYIGGCTVALYTHTTLGLLPALANIYIIWLWTYRSERRKGPAAGWVLVNLALLAAWSWWGWITWRQLNFTTTNVDWIPHPGWKKAAGMVLTAYGPSNGALGASALRTGLLIVGAAFLPIAAWGAARLGRDRAVMLAVFGIGAPALLYLISLHTPIMLPRTLFWAQFAIVIGLAAALTSIKPHLIAAALAAVGLIPIGLGLSGWGSEPKEPWREIVAALSERVGPSDLVLVGNVASGLAMQHYCGQSGCNFATVSVQSSGDIIARWATELYHGAHIAPAELPALLANRRMIWSVSRWDHYPRQYLEPLARRVQADLPVSLPAQMEVLAWRPDAPVVASR